MTRRDHDTGRKVMELQLHRKRKRERTNSYDVDLVNELGHAGVRRDGRLSVCSKCMENPLRQPFMGNTKEEERYSQWSAVAQQ